MYRRLWNYLPDAADLAAVALPELADGGAIAAAVALRRWTPVDATTSRWWSSQSG